MAETIPYTARDFESIVEELSNFITKTRPEVWSDFFESNLGVALIELAALVGDMLSFGMDAVSTEIFLSTLRRYDSALRFARSVGYQPRSSTPAEVTMVATNLPANIATAGGATIPAGTTITGANGLSYELLADVFINATDTVSRIQMFEGASFEETTAPTNQKGQTLISLNGVVAEGSWEVFVGDPNNPLNKWTEVERVKFADANAQVYETFFDGDGRLNVLFGDGINGEIPNANITLQYRTTSGLDGNSPTGSIVGTVQANLSGGGGGVVSIEFINSDGPASGGRDRESVDEMKANIPAFIRSSDKIITLDDYNTNLTRVAGISLVFTDLLLSSYSANTVKVHVWDEETVNFTSESPGQGDQSTVAYRRYTQVPLDRADDVQAFLAARTVTSVHNIILRPDTAFVDIYLGTVIYNPAVDRSVVHRALTQAVVRVFEQGTGFAVRISDIYNAIDSTVGVRHFYIERIVTQQLLPVSAEATLTIGPSQVSIGDWIEVDDGNEVLFYEYVAALGDPTAIPDAIPVVIGVNTEQTLLNTVNRIMINQQIELVAVNDLAAPVITATLKSAAIGTAGNTTNNDSDASDTRITLTDFTGGDDTPAVTWTDHRREQRPNNDNWVPGSYAEMDPFVTNENNGQAATAAAIGLVDEFQPASGVTITIDDGVGNVVVFEFDTLSPGSDISVPLGTTSSDTIDNLATAITGSALVVNVESRSTYTHTCYLTVADPNGELVISTTEASGNMIATAGMWIDRGQLPYKPIEDIIVRSSRASARFYDNTYQYNNEIRYDSGVASLLASIQALNLRRLVFDLVAETAQ